MKDVAWEGALPPCDLCGSPGCGAFNSPTSKAGAGGGRWANLCGPCFRKHGIDTSVTERRVLRPEPPAEVRAIALRWGGAKAEVRELEDGVWRFAEVQEDYGDAEGFVYVVYRPGKEFPCFEDDGRPSGTSTREDEWVVRCLNDAPDGWFTVSDDGTYRGYREEVKVW